MQQIIHPGQAVLDPELLLENASNILGPQRADTVGLRRTSQETLLEGGLLGRRQLAGATRLALGDDRLQPVITVGIHPQLHEPAAPRQCPCDLGSTVALQGQHHGAIAVPLFGVPLLLTALPQLFEIIRMVRCDLHGQFLPFLREYATGRSRALPYFNGRARIFPNPYQTSLGGQRGRERSRGETAPFLGQVFTGIIRAVHAV